MNRTEGPSWVSLPSSSDMAVACIANLLKQIFMQPEINIYGHMHKSNGTTVSNGSKEKVMPAITRKRKGKGKNR